MHLVPRNSFFREFIDDFFDTSIAKSGEMIRTDIYEEDENYVVEMDVPGFSKEDIIIDYNNDYLTISAKRETTKEETKNYIRRERYYGEYKRSFYVGDIDEAQIKANFKDGILKVVFPKKQLEGKSKKVITID